MTTRTIEYRTAEASAFDATPATHRWTAVVDGQVVSELSADIETGEILQVHTDADHREQGHATALYRTAAAAIDIYHAPVGHRTDDGDRFAARVGGPELTCTTCCVDLDADDDDFYRED